MPRKAKKTAKPPLLFLEQPSSGSRTRTESEVRAALNPRHFFTEETKASSSSLQAWVSPQFNRTALAAPPPRRGRRRCESAASVLDCTQLSRKTSVCKFPALSFQTRPRERQTKTTTTTQRSAEARHHAKKTRASSSNWTGTARRDTGTTDRHRNQAVNVGGAQADAPSSPPCGAGPLPDVDTPHVRQESSSPLHASVRLLLGPTSPPCGRPPHPLVADTPERDYGLKVTWRRRKAEMALLREGGHLSECDTLVQKRKSVSGPRWRTNT